MPNTDADGDQYSSSSTATTMTSGSSVATSPSSSSTGTTASLPMGATAATTSAPAMTTPYPSEPTDDGYWNGSKLKRQATNAGSTNFPKLVKMVEKRKPDNNVSPYCQQMQVLNNWQIVPIPNIPTICVSESEYAPAAATGGGKKAVRRGDTIQQLGSNCVCEWFSA